MLDYRAYKLLWLIFLPFRLIFVIASWGSMIIAIVTGASLDYGVPARIAIAYGIFFGINLVVMAIFIALSWFILLAGRYHTRESRQRHGSEKDGGRRADDMA